MGYQEYKASQRLELLALELDANAFFSLLMAAMRSADTDNLDKLQAAFPRVHTELVDRYNAPGGELSGEKE